MIRNHLKNMNGLKPSGFSLRHFAKNFASFAVKIFVKDFNRKGRKVGAKYRKVNFEIACRYFLSLLILSSVSMSFTLPVSASQEFKPNEKARKWAEKQLKNMSLDKKIGQIINVDDNNEF